MNDIEAFDSEDEESTLDSVLEEKSLFVNEAEYIVSCTEYESARIAMSSLISTNIDVDRWNNFSTEGNNTYLLGWDVY